MKFGLPPLKNQWDTSKNIFATKSKVIASSAPKKVNSPFWNIFQQPEVEIKIESMHPKTIGPKKGESWSILLKDTEIEFIPPKLPYFRHPTHGCCVHQVFFEFLVSTKTPIWALKRAGVGQIFITMPKMNSDPKLPYFSIKMFQMKEYL